MSLSQEQYLEKKLAEVTARISEGNHAPGELRKLYFRKGKLFSELQLIRRTIRF